MIKIDKLEIENVKRVKAVSIEPTDKGLTIIGGKNNQGKTSILDSIAWCLGGDRFRPSEAQRLDSVNPPHLRVTLSNGLIAERKGKNSDLKVIDPTGEKAGQSLLDAFVGQFALNLPKFMAASSSEKANTLLKIIGVGDKLDELDKEDTKIYNERYTIGRIKDQKQKYANELTFYPNAPSQLVSPAELIEKQQNILAQNGENQRKRFELGQLEKRREELLNTEKSLMSQLEKVRNELSSNSDDLENAKKTVECLIDEATDELENSIRNIEAINIMVRANLDREKAEAEAIEYQQQYDEMTQQISVIRQQKIDLLNGADLPLPGLSVRDGELIYNGFKWDGMSGSDQLKVSTAIVRKLNPDCGFVLLDKLEQMDIDTLNSFGEWLEQEGLQVIATRVSTGEECSIIIEDGYSVESEIQQPENKAWKAGQF